MHRPPLALSLLLAALPLRLVAQAPPAKASPQVSAPAANAAAAPGAPAQGAPAPGAPKPFADVVKEAKEIKGFFPIWQKDDKVWIEIRPEQLDKPFFFEVNISRGLGESRLYSGSMLDSGLVAFKKVGQTIQMLQKNLTQTARKGEAIAEAVATGFSDSLMASAPIASAPHPERKSFLVEANTLLFADHPAIALRLEQAYRQPYAFDARNTSYERVRNAEDLTTFDVQAHYMLPKVMLPPPVPMPGMPVPTTPQTLTDPRSFFLGLLYSFRKLPAEPMRPRLADDRIGYFTTRQLDFSEASDGSKDRVVHYISRWRLEKKDPAAAVSEPKEPIVYWLDKNMPEKWRKPITEGILEWNKAFERVGFKDAVQVKVQPADADWDTMDARNACVRWLVGSDVSYAIGPSTMDPRTGEILDADIGFGENMVRAGYRMFQNDSGRRAEGGFASQEAMDMALAAEQRDFAEAVLQARGELEPGSPEAEAFVAGWMKFLAIHEVGHTLALTHNFRGSISYSLEQLADPAFTRVHGHATSIMEYLGTNLAPKGEKQGDPFMTTLGPYDYWAIEYGYKPFDPAVEKAELAKIAARSHEKELAFGRDEEAHGGMDPEVNTWDIGPDTLLFARRQGLLYSELMDGLQAKTLKDGENYEVLTRQFASAMGGLGMACTYAAKYVGGVVHLRDHAGSPRLPLNPVPAARQREALQFLADSLFSERLFKFKPDFLRKLTIERLEFDRINADFDLYGRVLGMQRAVLGQLFGGGVAKRILNAEIKLQDPKQAFRLSELYGGVQSAVWSELKGGKDVTVIRRNLQREHLRQLTGQVLRATPDLPPDARSLARESLRSLQTQLRLSAAKPAFGKEARAHFQECLATIEETLKASVQRANS